MFDYVASEVGGIVIEDGKWLLGSPVSRACHLTVASQGSTLWDIVVLKESEGSETCSSKWPAEEARVTTQQGL